MWHTAAFSASVANGQTAAALNSATDTILRNGPNNGFLPFNDFALAYAIAAPTNGTAFHLKSTKFTPFSPIEIIPIQAAAKTANGLLIAGWPYRMPVFEAQDEILATVDTGGAAAGQETLVVGLAESYETPPNGEELILKWTSTTAAVIGSWVTVAITQVTTLKVGVYALLSSEVFSTNAIAHRWLFDKAVRYPGFPSSTGNGNQQWPGIRDYRLGVAGRFSNLVLPQLQVLCGAADASHTIWVRCIKER